MLSFPTALKINNPKESALGMETNKSYFWKHLVSLWSSSVHTMFLPFAKQGLDQDHDRDQEHVHNNLMKKQNKIERERERDGNIWRSMKKALSYFKHAVAELCLNPSVERATHHTYLWDWQRNFHKNFEDPSHNMLLLLLLLSLPLLLHEQSEITYKNGRAKSCLMKISLETMSSSYWVPSQSTVWEHWSHEYLSWESRNLQFEHWVIWNSLCYHCLQADTTGWLYVTRSAKTKDHMGSIRCTTESLRNHSSV